MMHTILKFLKRRWLISQNIAHFSTSGNLNETVDVKMIEKFYYFGSF